MGGWEEEEENIIKNCILRKGKSWMIITPQIINFFKINLISTFKNKNYSPLICHEFFTSTLLFTYRKARSLRFMKLNFLLFSLFQHQSKVHQIYQGWVFYFILTLIIPLDLSLWRLNFLAELFLASTKLKF